VLPLEGVRVLDLSRLLPGPYATLVLADLGADVVKVEDPRSGDGLRWLPPLVGSQSGAFHALNRNKRSLALDLKAEGGPAVLRRLASHFDVLVESFRPGVLDRLGAGYAALRGENPRVVFCALSGYGQTGPYRDLAGHDLNYCAIAGALALNGPEEAPIPCGVQPADMAGAWAAVTGILSALHRLSKTGEGGYVDVSMTEGVLGMLAMQLGMASARGAPLRRGREHLSGAAACYRAYRTLDGRFVALGALEPRFFARFCAAVGRPELASRQLEQDGRGPVEELEALFASRSRDAWTRLGREQDLCLTPVLEGDEPREDPQLIARGVFTELPTSWEGRSVPTIATPVRVDDARAPMRPAPELGADTDAVMAEAGFTEREIAVLRERGVVCAKR
jgi:crotonobetainyl-CoA:carnitine CoA-transferase CaiB-like acyl-CoA transferase